MKSARAPLEGCRVLVCRPEPKASELCYSLGRAGADARALPMIQIEPVAETGELRAVVQDFDQFQHVIVVSPIAADYLLEHLDHWWPQRPVGQKWYAVGSGTAKALAQAGIDSLAPARGHDSESLLQLDPLADLSNGKVIIAGGEGGRTLLAETLTQRGARVTKLALYRRLCPAYTPAQMAEALITFDPQVLITLSGETLNNLISLGQNVDSALYKRGLILPTARVAEQAKAAGFSRVFVAPDLGPAGLEQTLACAVVDLATAG